jgi:hypothetical protein
LAELGVEAILGSGDLAVAGDEGALAVVAAVVVAAARIGLPGWSPAAGPGDAAREPVTLAVVAARRRRGRRRRDRVGG